METCSFCLCRMSNSIKEGCIQQSYAQSEALSLKGRLYEERESIAQQVRNCVRPSAVSAIVKRLQKLQNEWEQQTYAKKS